MFEQRHDAYCSLLKETLAEKLQCLSSALNLQFNCIKTIWIDME